MHKTLSGAHGTEPLPSSFIEFLATCIWTKHAGAQLKLVDTVLIHEGQPSTYFFCARDGHIKKRREPDWASVRDGFARTAFAEPEANPHGFLCVAWHLRGDGSITWTNLTEMEYVEAFLTHEPSPVRENLAALQAFVPPLPGTGIMRNELAINKRTGPPRFTTALERHRILDATGLRSPISVRPTGKEMEQLNAATSSLVEFLAERKDITIQRIAMEYMFDYAGRLWALRPAHVTGTKKLPPPRSLKSRSSADGSEGLDSPGPLPAGSRNPSSSVRAGQQGPAGSRNPSVRMAAPPSPSASPPPRPPKSPEARTAADRLAKRDREEARRRNRLLLKASEHAEVEADEGGDERARALRRAFRPERLCPGGFCSYDSDQPLGLKHLDGHHGHGHDELGELIRSFRREEREKHAAKRAEAGAHGELDPAGPEAFVSWKARPRARGFSSRS
eukprot:tig00000133_g7702.t1